jgi:hypothetical protein
MVFYFNSFYNKEREYKKVHDTSYENKNDPENPFDHDVDVTFENKVGYLKNGWEKADAWEKLTGKKMSPEEQKRIYGKPFPARGSTPSLKGLKKKKYPFRLTAGKIILILVLIVGVPTVGRFLFRLMPVIFDSITISASKGDYKFEKNKAKDAIIITRYSGKETDIVIPAEIDGLPVLMIARDVFKGSSITSVIIPEGVTDIGNRAFQNSESLISVALPKSIERIGSSAFENCTSLVEVKVPSGTRIIYGNYVTASLGSQTVIESLGNHGIFNEGQPNPYHHTFLGSSGISAASQQAIKNSGYTGAF